MGSKRAYSGVWGLFSSGPRKPRKPRFLACKGSAEHFSEFRGFPRLCRAFAELCRAFAEPLQTCADMCRHVRDICATCAKCVSDFVQTCRHVVQLVSGCVGMLQMFVCSVADVVRVCVTCLQSVDIASQCRKTCCTSCTNCSEVEFWINVAKKVLPLAFPSAGFGLRDLWRFGVREWHYCQD